MTYHVYHPQEHFLYVALVDGYDLASDVPMVAMQFRPYVDDTDERYFGFGASDPTHAAPWWTPGRQANLSQYLNGVMTWAGQEGRWYYVDYDAAHNRWPLYSVDDNFSNDSVTKLADNILSTDWGLNEPRITRIKKVFVTNPSDQVTIHRIITHERSTWNGLGHWNSRIFSMNLDGSDRKLITTLLNPITPSSGSEIRQHRILDAWCFSAGLSAMTGDARYGNGMYLLTTEYTTTGSAVTAQRQRIDLWNWISFSQTYGSIGINPIRTTPVVNPSQFEISESEEWHVIQLMTHNANSTANSGSNNPNEGAPGLIYPLAIYKNHPTLSGLQRTSSRIVVESPGFGGGQLMLPNPSEDREDVPGDLEHFAIGCPTIAWFDSQTRKFTIWVNQMHGGESLHFSTGLWRCKENGSDLHAINKENRRLSFDGGTDVPLEVSQQFIPGPGCYQRQDACL